MKNIKDFTDRELLENIFSAQVEILRRVDRLEGALEEIYSDVEREKSFPSHGKHLDKIYENILEKKDELYHQLEESNYKEKVN